MVTTNNGERSSGLEGWLAGKKAISPASRLGYEQSVREFLEWLGRRAEHPLDAITERDIDQYVDHLLKTRSAGTVNKLVRKYLSGAFEKARKLGKIKYNPVAATDPLKHRGIAKGKFSPEQVARLVAAAEGDWKGAILFGYGHAARLQDVANLRWSSLDLENGVVRFTERKTAAVAVVGLHADFVDWLTQQSTPEAPDAFVFPSLANRSGAGRNGLSKAFERIMDRAGIESAVLKSADGSKGRNVRALSFHSLRHTAASEVFNAEAIKEVQRRVTNHARGGVIERYTHADLDLIKQAALLIPRVPRNG